MDDSTITCDEIIESYDEEIKTILTNFNEKKTTCKTPNFCILLVFLLITIELLISAAFTVIRLNTKQNKYIYYHFNPQITN